MNAALRESGWVWEGLGFDPGVKPSIYGVGEGAPYFGAPGANFIFHENTEVTLAKLAHLPRVTADISKWEWYETKAADGRFTFAQHRDDSPGRVADEAEKVGRLSLEFPNLVGAFIDDTHGVAAHDEYSARVPACIRDALHRHNPALDLWIVVYVHELDKPYWRDWKGAVDVVNLWVWDCRELVRVEEAVARCRDVFPDQRIVLGIYLRDYPSRAPVPLDLLEIELEAIVRLMDKGLLAGYSILGGCLIDRHPEQAAFVRDFIRSH